MDNALYQQNANDEIKLGIRIMNKMYKEGLIYLEFKRRLKDSKSYH